MKKKKSFGLYGTNKRRQSRKYNGRYDMEYEDYIEEEEAGGGTEEEEDADEYIVDYQADTGETLPGGSPKLYADSYGTEDYAEDTRSYYGSAEEEYIDNDEYCESLEYSDEGEYYEEEFYDSGIGQDEFESDEDFDIGGYEAGGYDEYDEGSGYYEDGEFYDDEYYEYDDGSSGSFFSILISRIKAFAANLTAFDFIVAATGIIVIIAAAVTFSIFHEGKKIEERIEAIEPVGDELINVGIIGDKGLIAMTGAAVSGQFMTGEAVTEEAYTSETENEAPQQDQPSKVSVNFVSVEKDLKIRFTDFETGELITGTAFEVVLTNSKGKKLVLTDDDMDGIIYADNVNPGVFEAVITSTDKYKFPSAAQKVTVKDKVEYVVINIQDEVKKESQINVAAEDTQRQDAVQEEVKLTDTVEWVESTSTPLSGTESYLLVDKNTIADPSQVSRLGARMFFDGLNVEVEPAELSLFVNGTAALKGTTFENTDDEGVKKEYTYEWKSSDGNIASVDSNGNVTAKAKGTAVITYTVTRKTTEKTKLTKEVEKEISIEEYEKLSPDEKSKCEPVYEEASGEGASNAEGSGEEASSGEASENDDAKEKKIEYYKYTALEAEDGEPQVTSDTASAACEITVNENGIKSGTLELQKSADSCAAGASLTVSPSKLVYTNDDGSTQTITEGFPSVKWSSSNDSVAAVNDKGVVTGVKAGSATIKGVITVKNSAGSDINIEASTEVKIIEAPVFSIVLDRTDNVYLNVGGETTLSATVSNAKSDSGVTWTTSDEKIATVDENGKVKAVAVGSATITAATKEKDAEGRQLTASCKVTVNSNAANDTTTKLKDKNGSQIYIKADDGSYKEAVYADYYTAKEFYIKTEGQLAYTGWQTINGRTYYYDKNGNVVTGTQIIQGVTYNFGSDGAIATTVNGSTFGIDVSRHNGNIDWNAVKASGVDYVILRCGYRGSATGVLIEDESFRKNIKGAAEAGLKVGIYVFSQAVDEVEAVKEASLAVSLAKGYKLTYPIFIDTESSGGRADKIDKATRTAVVNAFCQTVASAGYQAGIYASKTWFEDKLNMGAVGSYRIWLAQYAAQPTYKSRYDMWQYSSKGTISGIKGDVDLNWSYMGY